MAGSPATRVLVPSGQMRRITPHPRWVARGCHRGRSSAAAACGPHLEISRSEEPHCVGRFARQLSDRLAPGSGGPRATAAGRRPHVAVETTYPTPCFLSLGVLRVAPPNLDAPNSRMQTHVRVGGEWESYALRLPIPIRRGNRQCRGRTLDRKSALIRIRVSNPCRGPLSTLAVASRGATRTVGDRLLRVVSVVQIQGTLNLVERIVRRTPEYMSQRRPNRPDRYQRIGERLTQYKFEQSVDPTP